ncbi:MAG TPA: alpha/beta hydrolase [Vicinamibacterales bacterium]|nr:alpha/beta hydrolase [Vicinamibacterales bacterium]
MYDPSVHRQYLHVDSRTIAYFDSAPRNDSAKVIVLVHGFPLAASMWEAQFKALPEGWRLIAPDLRGFGGSTLDTLSESPSIDDYATDVVDVLKELGISKAVIGGCAMGGYVTFAVVRQAPAAVRALILAGTRAGADSLETRANRRSMLAVLDREGSSGVAREIMPKLLGKTTCQERPEVESSVRRLIKQQTAVGIRGAVVRMMARPDCFEMLTSIELPSLIIVGDEDTLTPVVESRRMADAVKTAELVIVPRAGHLANLEQPAAFNAAVGNFLSRL